MSKYTAKQVEYYARWTDIGLGNPVLADVSKILGEYAALLRERESAKVAVTDAIAVIALNACRDNIQRQGYSRPVSGPDGDAVHIKAMRAALEAVAPMLASQDQEPMRNDQRAESGDAEEIAQWLYANGYHVAAYTIRTQLDIRNKMLASARVPDAKTMVRRFLAWRLPDDFLPDAGISFDRSFAERYPAYWPVGTNLLTADQAEQMVRHMLAEATKPETEE